MNKLDGLNDKIVVENRKKYGTNEISKVKANSFLSLLLESLGDPIIKILLIALAIKIVFLFKEFDWFETIGIMIAIFLASFISTISEYGSEKAFKKLQEESAKIKCNVKRNGKVTSVSIDEIVKDDIVLLESGDKVPADALLIEGVLYIDESSINGEAKEVLKERIIGNKALEKNKVFRGTIVYSGSGIIKITEVGDKTFYGKIAVELQEKAQDSPLKLRLRSLAKIISMFGYVGAFLASFSYLFSVIIIDNHFVLEGIIGTITNFSVMMNHLIYVMTL
ncbi:MAG: HAD-IC family P-type ATPase, partial [Bacilli bacterium]